MRKKRRKVEGRWAPGAASAALVEASGKALCEFRIPGSIVREKAKRKNLKKSILRRAARALRAAKPAEVYRALEEEFIQVAKPEDLRQEDRDIYEAVRGTGLGICGRCRWRAGCQSCDEVKAWGYACRSTLWHTAHEGVRPKAKPKGRPKKAAAKA